MAGCQRFLVYWYGCGLKQRSQPEAVSIPFYNIIIVVSVWLLIVRIVRNSIRCK